MHSFCLKLAGPHSLNYASSPHVVSSVTNIAQQWKKIKPKLLNTGVCTVVHKKHVQLRFGVQKLPVF